MAPRSRKGQVLLELILLVEILLAFLVFSVGFHDQLNTRNKSFQFHSKQKERSQ